MNLSKHDQEVLEQIQKDLERITGKKATHVFIDTKDTVSEMDIVDWCVDCAAPKGGILNSGCPTCDNK